MNLITQAEKEKRINELLSNPVQSAAEIEQLRQRVQELAKQRDELLAALEHFATWARGQHRAQRKGCHATFDMRILRAEIDFAEAAIASVKELK